MKLVLPYLSLLSLWLFSIALASAAEPVAQSEENNYDINLYIENDTRALSLLKATDRNYTSGIRFSYLFADERLPGWGNWIASFIPGLRRGLEGTNSKFNIGMALGQQMYTPHDLSNPNPNPLDRPYAGYLYAGLMFYVQNNDWLHSWELDVGVIGPPSLAEQAQKLVHSVIGAPEPQGWANQLRTEPTLSVAYQLKRTVWALPLSDGTHLCDVIPYVGAALGNVFIYAGVGSTIRFGYHMTDDFGPSNLSPIGLDPYIVARGESQSRRHRFFEMYAFAAGEARGILRNIFLDGNTFVSSPSINKYPYSLEYNLGLVVRLGKVRLVWQQVSKSPEFQGESILEVYGSLSVTYSYRF